MTAGSPVPRIAWGLVVLTTAVLMLLDLVGVLPDEEPPWIRERVETADRLARQAAKSAHENDLRGLAAEFEVAARIDEGLRSVGLRSRSGRLLLATRAHRESWQPELRDDPEQMRVLIRRDGDAWADLELHFADPPVTTWLISLWRMPVVRLTLMLGALSFCVYVFYLRRILTHLDPSAVVPPRVRAALDIMTEGVVLVDEEHRIALANATFARAVDEPTERLLGRSIESFEWLAPGDAHLDQAYPWRGALDEGLTIEGRPLRLEIKDSGTHVYKVNAAPVLDGWGKPKGAMVTFDDVTEIEARNRELEHAIEALEASHLEVQTKAAELERLSKRDPLTDVANRRSFMPLAERELQASIEAGTPLSCLMADIDFFKAVNDTHGHAAGDAVIESVARCLAGTVRSSDLVCRYGGEEFCVLLPSAPLEAAMRVGERMRQTLDTPGFGQFPITASFGVATLRSPPQSLAELMEEADTALYASKRRGRNRVTHFGDHEESKDEEMKGDRAAVRPVDESD